MVEELITCRNAFDTSDVSNSIALLTSPCFSYVATQLLWHRDSLETSLNELHLINVISTATSVRAGTFSACHSGTLRRLEELSRRQIRRSNAGRLAGLEDIVGDDFGDGIGSGNARPSNTVYTPELRLPAATAGNDYR